MPQDKPGTISTDRARKLHPRCIGGGFHMSSEEMVPGTFSSSLFTSGWNLPMMEKWKF